MLLDWKKVREIKFDKIMIYHILQQQYILIFEDTVEDTWHVFDSNIPFKVQALVTVVFYID